MSLLLSPLTSQARPLFEFYLDQSGRTLSAYSFIIHCLWSDLFNFYWSVRDDHFLLFAEYDRCFYMPLPPLGSRDARIVRTCFDWMDAKNPNNAISRIENILEAELAFYQACGLSVSTADSEYLYLRQALMGLQGNRYKTQRWACNRFEKQYCPCIRPYRLLDQAAAMTLFEKWEKGRAMRHPEYIYLKMLCDAKLLHRRILLDGPKLGMMGLVIEVDEGMVGYTFGFLLNQETFCVVAEVTDLNYTGAAAYLFRALCKMIPGVRWINVMGDSGLENIRRVKLSYRPEKCVGAYVAQYDRCGL